jgi:hypothetical protein
MPQPRESENLTAGAGDFSRLWALKHQSELSVYPSQKHGVRQKEASVAQAPTYHLSNRAAYRCDPHARANDG